MENLKISKTEFEALVRGFSVSESEGWNNVSPDEYSHFPAVAAYPEVFSEGVKLRGRVNMVISADSNSDYARDLAAYDKTVEALNEKYGRVAVLSDEVDLQKSPGYGIIGYRFSPWKQMTVTTYRNGQEPEVSVRFSQEEVTMEDEKVRQKMGLEL